MPRSDVSALQLTCPGCGDVVGLGSSDRLVASVRPFVEQHRACGVGKGTVDLEMRSAYARSA